MDCARLALAAALLALALFGWAWARRGGVVPGAWWMERDT